jgi:hypothetical protein
MASMGIKLNFDGMEFEAATAAEAAELYRQLRNASTVPPPSAARAPIIHANKQPRTEDEPEGSFPDWTPIAAIAFLKAIRDAGPQGAGSGTMMAALGITMPKALGGRSAIINRLIVDCGLNPSQVYDNKRTGQGRFWKMKRHLPDAISAIEKRLAAQRAKE